MTPEPLNITPILCPAKIDAKLIGVSESTLWALDSAESIPRKLRIGKRVVWRYEDLLLWSRWGLPDRERFEQRLAGIVKNARIENAMQQAELIGESPILTNMSG